eukprot:evm.model.scf_1661.5 EVM.evm.TU.scf_1661.5   scf_1661:28814-31236(+)
MFLWDDVVDVSQNERGDAFAATAAGLVACLKPSQLNWGIQPAEGPPAEPPAPWHVYRPSPPPPFGVGTVRAGHCGRIAALLGRGADACRLGLLDLRQAGRVGDEGADGVSREPACAFRELEGLGADVVQASWFPRSDEHLAVLTRDGRFLVFDAADPSEPEQAFRLSTGPRRGWGLVGEARRAVAFAFAPRRLWGSFAVFFLMSDGEVFLLCPVVPIGAKLSAGLGPAVGRTVEEWGLGREAESFLQQVIPEVEEPTTGSRPPSSETSNSAHQHQCLSKPSTRPGYMVAKPPFWTACPALQGPINKGGDSVLSGMRFLNLWVSERDGVTVITTASEAGTIFVHLLTQEVQPLWSGQRPPSGLVPCIKQDTQVAMTLVDVVLLGQGSCRRRAVVYSDPACGGRFVVSCEDAVYFVEIGWLDSVGLLGQEHGMCGVEDDLDLPTVMKVHDEPLGRAALLGCLFWLHSTLLLWLDEGMRLVSVNGNAVLPALFPVEVDIELDPIDLEGRSPTADAGGLGPSGDPKADGEPERQPYLERLEEQRSTVEDLLERFELLLEKGVRQEEQWARMRQLMQNLEARYAMLAECIDILHSLPSRGDGTVARELCRVDVDGLRKRVNVVQKNVGIDKAPFHRDGKLHSTMAKDLKSKMKDTGAILKHIAGELQHVLGCP